MIQTAYSVDILALPLGELSASLAILEDTGVSELYGRAGDNAGFGVGVDLIRAVRRHSSLPIHLHLDTTHPERHVETFVAAGCNAVTVQLEVTEHIHRVLTCIRELGAEPGVAIYPGTPLTKLSYALPQLARVLSLLTDSGAPRPVHQKLAYERAKLLKDHIQHTRYPIAVEAGYGLDLEVSARLARAGADRLIMDKTVIDEVGVPDLANAIKLFVSDVTRQYHLV